MTAILKRIDDPRSALDRTRRIDLVRYAREVGISEISEQMPANLIRKVFADKGIHRIPGAKVVSLGQVGAAAGSSTVAAAPVATEGEHEIDADADLARQFAAESQRPAPPAERKPVAQMSINELGKEMKRLKIKRDRRDNMITMAAKIEAHGKNPS